MLEFLLLVFVLLFISFLRERSNIISLVEKECGVRCKTAIGAIHYAKKQFLDMASKEVEETTGVKKHFKTFTGSLIYFLLHQKQFS